MVFKNDKITIHIAGKPGIFRIFLWGGFLLAVGSIFWGATLIAQETTSPSETPLIPASRNRPAWPTGETADNHYPADFLTLSTPSEIGESQKGVTRKVTAPVAKEKDKKDPIYLLAAVFAVVLFLIVAWLDHLYRVRLDSIITQNNRLLNGEDIDPFIDLPSLGIPLLVANDDSTLAQDLTPAVTEALSEPVSEEVSKIRE